MESIKQLREICQASNQKSDDYLTKKLRFFSIYFTWFFLHFPLTANQLTAGMIFFQLVMGFFLTRSYELKFAVSGIILYHLYWIMDLVDGEVSRYKKSTSITGKYYDIVAHHIFKPYVFFCIGVSLVPDYGDWGYYLGFLSAFSHFFLSTVENCRYEAQLLHLRHYLAQDQTAAPQTGAGPAKKNISFSSYNDLSDQRSSKLKGFKKYLARFDRFVYNSNYLMIEMWVVCTILILNLLVGNRGFEVSGFEVKLIFILLLYYTLSPFYLATMSLYSNVKNRTIDSLFNELSESIELRRFKNSKGINNEH